MSVLPSSYCDLMSPANLITMGDHKNNSPTLDGSAFFTITFALLLPGFYFRFSSRPLRSVLRPYFFVAFANPICFRLGSGGVMSCRIASNTTLNCASYFISIPLSLRASSALETSI